MTHEELIAILNNHLLWLIGDPNGHRANLSGADLTGPTCEEVLQDAQ